MGFNDLLPVPNGLDPNLPIPGLRLFSNTRALALAGWLGGLEPVRLRIEKRQLILEAGQDDSWLVTDLDQAGADAALEALSATRTTSAGLQFIAVQTTPDNPRFEGFFMLRDQPEP